MRVVKQRENGIVQRVVLIDDHGGEVLPVNRFLSHLVDSGYSPNTVCAYGYDPRPLAQFLTDRAMGWNDFRPATALELLGYLRRVPSRRCNVCCPRRRASSTGRSRPSSTRPARTRCSGGSITR